MKLPVASQPRSRWLLASLGGAALVSAGLWCASPSLFGTGNAAEPRGAESKPVVADAKPVEPVAARRQAEEPKEKLPIAQVILYSSGVGYFQREGSVEGDARVDLSFDVRDVNDLIKSMTLRDLDGGHVSAVSYDSNAPVERTLQSFAINLNGSPSFGQILGQARGEKVEVVLQQAAQGQPGAMSGTLIGVETQTHQVGKDATVAVEVLNLWCADGVRSCKLSEVQRLRFLNPAIDSEFRKALETLALSHDTQKKAVSIQFAGEGKRRVKVGYVVESPIWKTSYRLVLDKQGKSAPYLQGWAVVENTTDEDWKDVRMALVSGRPISFRMNLYDPLFVQRPFVEPELFASLRPVAYSGSLEKPPERRERMALRALSDAEDEGLGLRGGEPAKKQEAKAGLAGAGGTNGAFARDLEKKLDEKMELGGTAAPIAQATKLGDSFQYVIDRPVTLPRQKSALLPIVGKEVEASRVSIYNEKAQAKFPLLGLRLKNTSGLHLMQGPITVFEGSSYAGDARILGLQPNEERLISYAVDLGCEVNPVPASDNGRITTVKAVKGVLYTSTKVRETKTYTVVNRNEQERLVLIEHPVRNDFKLVDTDKPAETAADCYRFELKVAPGKTAKQVVTEEHVLNEQVQLTNLDDNAIRHFLNQPATSAKVKAALEETMKLRYEVARTQRDLAEQERQLKVITDDQARLRANLREMPQTAAASKRYLEKFDLQESQIESMQQEVERLRGVAFKQRKELEDFLAALNLA